MNKWKNYHKTSSLDIDMLSGSKLKRLIFSWTQKYHINLFYRLLGIPQLPKDAKRILDVGCGIGYTLQVLKRLYPKIEPYSVDIVKTEDLPEEIKFLKIDLNKDSLPFSDNTFDFVICRGVIEHLPEPTYSLSEVYRVLKKGGAFHVLTENYTSCFIPHLGFTNYTTNFYDDYTHIRPYTKKSLERMLRNCGFVSIKTSSPKNLIIILLTPTFFYSKCFKDRRCWKSHF